MFTRLSLALLMAASVVLGAFSPRALAADSQLYFQETGHSVTGAFLDFFQNNGGLTIFGYPRTEAIVENGRTVQYFQRARFEAWPENPDPFKVQLALLGDIVLGPGDPPIPAGAIPSPNDPDQRYFPESGHTVGFAFLNFFNNNGGLAVFGYPTTEARPENGFLVQHFQRARLEWHPENPDPYTVELGLLGDEYIYKMGKVALSLTKPIGPTATASAAVVPSAQGKIAIMLDGGGDIMVANGDGSGLRPFTNGFDPVWSPDGSQLAVTRYDTPHGVYVIDANTGAEKKVWDIDYARYPTWSPDGTRIAFQDPFVVTGFIWRGGRPIPTTDQRYGISGVNLTNGNGFGLPSDLRSWTPNYSPDGKSILFKGDKGLYLTDDTNGLRLIPNSLNFLSPAWSADGKKIIAAWKQHDHYEIVSINPDGSGFQNLTNTQVFGQQAFNNLSPTVSPDGTQIAFVTDREGSWKVYVMNADGSNQHKLLETPPIQYEQSVERIISWGR